jgi:hypothetical protein
MRFRGKRLRIFIFILLVLYSSILFCQQPLHREKVYIHFDKSYYLPGETCWFKAYVIQAMDLLPTTLSGVLYVDLIDPNGKVIEHQKLKINEGESNGNFLFSEAALAGHYNIRAYTRLMRNLPDEFFFSWSFMLYRPASLKPDAVSSTVSKEIDLQFFPEGGSAVKGLQSKIAFRAIDAWGNGIDVNGKIVDKNNKQVAIIKCMHNGMGVFPYTPSNEKFSIILDNGETFELPQALESGVVMSVNNISPEKIRLEIRSSNKVLLTNFRLVGIMNSKLIFDKQIEANDGKSYLEIPKKGLPGGILQLSLFDLDNIPCADRIVFVDNKRLMHIYVEPLPDTRRKNDSVSFTIRATDDQGKPVETFLSVAVTDADFVSSNPMSANISTHFLFESDIKGKVDDPAWYFQDTGNGNVNTLDLVMLTHGWRKFDNLLPVTYEREMSLTLRGKVVSKQGRKPIFRANLTLMLGGIDYMGVFTTTADESGSFFIDSIDYSDSTNLVWQIRNERGKLVDADIMLVDSIDIPLVTSVTRADYEKKTTQGLPAAGEKTIREFSASKKVEMLPKVVVVGGRSQSFSIGMGGTLIRPGSEDYHLFASSFISRYVPELPFLKNDRNSRWLLSSRKPVWFVIDGNLVDDIGPTTNPYLLMNSYRTDEIEYIIVSGSMRKGYTISIRTKSDRQPSKTGIIHQFASGYRWAKTFYKPKFEDPMSFPYRATTIHWDPYVATDAEGKAVVNIPSREARTLTVTVQGISQGTFGATVTDFKVR